MDEHKNKCLEIFSSHFDPCWEGNNFLKQFVTGDETWVHLYQPETKRNSMQPQEGKFMLTNF
jgi:hypothetical protein